MQRLCWAALKGGGPRDFLWRVESRMVCGRRHHVDCPIVDADGEHDAMIRAFDLVEEASGAVVESSGSGGPLSVFGACCLAMRTRRTIWITQRSNAVTYRWDVICADGCGLELIVATELAKLLGECVPGGVVLRVRQRRGIWSTSMMREIRGLYADRTGP